MASPQKPPHAETTKFVGRWLDDYEEYTPGTKWYPGVTHIMGPESEPEPDHCLLILPKYGGQIRMNRKGYFVGSPELLVETAYTTESRDLHQKKADYEVAGVREFVVVALRSSQVFWFRLRVGKFAEVRPDADGIFRSKIFLGLWFEPAAILGRDRKQLLAVIAQGLATPEHEAFVAKLASRKRRRGRN
jgi:Uma2 family endonuclease